MQRTFLPLLKTSPIFRQAALCLSMSMLFMLGYNTGKAQDTQSTPPWSGFGIEANGLYGKVFKHEAKFTLPLPKYTRGLDVDLLVHTYGKKEWEQRRNYPTIGIGFTYTNYGIDSVYGRAFSIYPNITLPIVSGRKLEWTLRIGDGIGYLTRDYSRANPVDTINVAIGSHINDFFMFMTDLRYHINKHWDIQLGGNFTHMSDASYHKPNLGINMYGAHIGIRFSPVNSHPKKIERNLKPLKRRWLFEARGTMSFESASAPDGPVYPVYLASAYVSKRWLSKNKFFGGMDYSYHEGIYAFLRNNGSYPGEEAAHSYKTAVFAGNEFLLGRVGVVLQVGYYLQQSAEKLDAFYEKIGGNLYLVQREHGPIKEFFLCAFLKTHLSVAELGEAGFGIGF